MSAVVVVTGGPPHAHDFVASSSAIATVLTRAGHRVQVRHDVDDAFCALVAGGDRPAAVVVNALLWRMEGEKYDAWRDEWAYSPSAPAREAVTAYVHGGGALVGSHTASICFDDWPGWGELLGGGWVWGTSSHPPVGPVTVHRAADVEHPVLSGVPATFDTVDEVYGDQLLHPGTVPLAFAKRHAADADQPVAWVAERGRGRVAYLGLGHDAAAVSSPVPARLLANMVAWASRMPGVGQEVADATG